MIYSVRTTVGRENIVAELINSNAKANNLDIKSIARPGELKGYIFIEADDVEIVRKAVQGVMHVKGVINKPVNVEEIKHFFEAKKAKVSFKEGDIVEIIGGPFVGERGKIQRIDKVKDEVTIELIEASIPIPVTISTELIKLVSREKVKKE
ncbi:MAG: transcription elongation factor Spt5 [Candidatus Aenigmatarchaeota archaeon]|nr:MAG: transcription elongation factor Spt5 [Candidatus Aenigmarchaeota archaeon]